MKLYAELPARRLGQLLLDLLVLALLALCVWAGRQVYDTVGLLAGPGRSIEQAGTGFAGSVDRAGDRIDNVPGIGGALRAPFDAVAGAGRQLEQAGRAQQEVVGRIALVVGLTVAGFPALLLVLAWLPRRLRWMRDAGDAHKLRGDSPGDLALFAWRAVARRPLGELRRAVDDPGGALLAGDYAALAALELHALGLRVEPRRARASRRSRA
jgi:hypothetical protein